MRREDVKLWDVKIPRKMLKYKPKLYKIMGMKAYYERFGHFYGEVIVNTNYKILDGYVIFYTAREMKIYDIPVKIVTKRDRLKSFFRKVVRKIGIKNHRLY